jgi:hypothetical protein
METDYFEKYLKENEKENTYEGFTLFQHNSSNYLYTKQSYPSFMSGTIYKGQDYKNWEAKSDDLRLSLKKLGYINSTYAKKAYLSSNDSFAMSTSDVFQKQTQFKHPFLVDYISYWLVRALPATLANQSLVQGRKIGNWLFERFNSKNKQYLKVKSISDGIEPLSGVFVLNQLTQDEELSRNSHNEFVVAQAVLPHGPYVIDGQCKYRGKKQGNMSQHYYNQVECAASLVENFLTQLKHLKRYDSSIVVIMGDHGSGWTDTLNRTGKESPQPLNKQFSPWSQSQIISRSSALLMIKPAGTKNIPLKYSIKESQLIDIYPTLLGLIGQSKHINKRVDGNNLFNETILPRKKYITFHHPSNVIDPYNAEIYNISYEKDTKTPKLIYQSKLKTESDMLPLICNQALSFTKGVDSFTTAGLSGVEKNGRWSNSETVKINVKFPKQACESSQIVFGLSAFMAKNRPFQKAKVLLNNNEIGLIEYKLGKENTNLVKINIPTMAMKLDAINTFEFQIDHPVSPKSLGLSTDDRKLALMFKTLELQ